jgi:hypothetical protein
MARRVEQIRVDVNFELDEAGRRELDAFASYCASRIDREVGEPDWWITVEARRGGYTCIVRATGRGSSYAVAGIGPEPAIAVWNAMCRVEQPLRELRARTSGPQSVSAARHRR